MKRTVHPEVALGASPHTTTSDYRGLPIGATAWPLALTALFAAALLGCAIVSCCQRAPGDSPNARGETAATTASPFEPSNCGMYLPGPQSYLCVDADDLWLRTDSTLVARTGRQSDADLGRWEEFQKLADEMETDGYRAAAHKLVEPYWRARGGRRAEVCSFSEGKTACALGGRTLVVRSPTQREATLTYHVERLGSPTERFTLRIDAADGGALWLDSVALAPGAAFGVLVYMEQFFDPTGLGRVDLGSPRYVALPLTGSLPSPRGP